MAGDGEMWPMIGIDLGTTNSCVAVWHDGQVKIIPNEVEKLTTPSCVSFTDYGRLIGETAMNQASKNLENTIFDAKRLIGRRFSNDIVQQDTKLWPFKVIDGTDLGKTDQPMIVVNYLGKVKEFTPEEICAMTIAKMKGVAEAFLGTTVKNAVITVPAQFNNAQRQATKDAGAIAGLNVIRLINEPTAAAMAYSLDAEINKISDTEKNVLVFHLGGGTFDVSLVEIKKGEIRVKSTSGDSHLGGRDFDNGMVREFVKQFQEKHNKDINENPRALARLRVASEKAKKVLSLVPEADVEIDCLFEDSDFNSTITCADFENLNMDIFRKFMEAIEQCLKSACIQKGDVDDVVLVGGSSRVPKVQNMLKEYFEGKEHCKSIQTDEAVASGAAIHAAILCGVFARNKDIFLTDITPLSFHVNINRSNKSLQLPGNTAIPTKLCYPYDIDLGRPSDIMFVVFEGENKKFEFVSQSIIPSIPQQRGTLQILVYFAIDVDGILNVSAGTNDHMIPVVKWNGRLSKEHIERMIQEAKSYKAQDEERTKLLDAKSELESYAYTTLEKLNDAGSINNEEVEDKIREAVDATFQWMEQNSDLSQISGFKEKLNELENKVEKLLHVDYMSS